METHLHQELDKLEEKIMKMFSLTERALENSIQALINREDEIATQVIEGDQELNQMEVEIEELTLNILALWQPVAKDLRFVMACARVANDLERIGDQSTNVAERALMLNRKPKVSFMNAIQNLADVVMEMFRSSLEAFTNRDCEAADEVCKKDIQADELNIKIIKNLIDYMSTESIIVERAVHSIIVSNALERVGDLSTNIGEDIVFIVRGINVRHSQKFDSSCL